MNHYQRSFIHTLVFFTLGFWSCTGEIATDPAETKFLLVRTPATKTEIIFGDVNSLNSSGLKRHADTYFLIDGFTSPSDTPMLTITRNELLQKKPNCNVIIVNWEKLNGHGNFDVNKTVEIYFKVLRNIKPVAERVADFLNFLVTEAEIDLQRVHLITHSLGCDVGSATGSWIKTKYGSLVGRITGLDPANQALFLGSNLFTRRLQKGDAGFVDLYHTDQGGFGDVALTKGNIDVYINGGKALQPGCEDRPKDILCSHSYSYLFWNMCTDTDSCIACPCSGAECLCKDCSPVCIDEGITLGVNLNSRNATGVYYIRYGKLHK